MRNKLRPEVRRRASALWLVAGGLMVLAGCVLIPVDYYQTGSRHNVGPKIPGVLQPGISTKEEVLLMLGESEFVSEDGQRLGYAWTKVKALWFVGGPGGGAAGVAERSYVLETSFDTNNRLSRVRTLKEWGPLVSPARELNVKQ